MTEREYVHGYSAEENERLVDQADTLTDLLHHDTAYPRGAKVLEAGCGVGAQTVTLAMNSLAARFSAIDVCADSLGAAQARAEAAGIVNVEFQQADIFHLPFKPETFDHVFVCFVLEHLPQPAAALQKLLEVLKPGGTLTAIEGDHGSAFFHPHSAEAQRAIQCLIDLQAQGGGNALIGRELRPLLTAAGLRDVAVSPRFVHADASRPEMIEGFTLNTFTAMVAGIREQVLTRGMMDQPAWDKGIADLRRTAKPDGVFCYTFFKGSGVK